MRHLLRSSTLWLLVLAVACLALIPVLRSRGTTSPIDPMMQRYERARAALLRRADKDGIDPALVQFRAMVEDDPLLSNLCHPLAHDVGHAAYQQEGIAALNRTEDICGSGYLHGVIESHFAVATDIEKSLQTTCRPDAGKCFHGMGHGLMYANGNDVPRSVKLCATLPNAYSRNQCDEGVFMELYETDLQTHFTPYLRKEEPFYPCGLYDDPVRGVCAFYAPRWYLRVHEGAYADALQWCLDQHTLAINACSKGVGSRAMQEHVATPLVARDICDGARADQRPYCISGMVSYYIVHFASIRKGREFCIQLEEADRATCMGIVSASERFYPDTL